MFYFCDSASFTELSPFVVGISVVSKSSFCKERHCLSTQHPFTLFPFYQNPSFVEITHTSPVWSREDVSFLTSWCWVHRARQHLALCWWILLVWVGLGWCDPTGGVCILMCHLLIIWLMEGRLVILRLTSLICKLRVIMTATWTVVWSRHKRTYLKF